MARIPGTESTPAGSRNTKNKIKEIDNKIDVLKKRIKPNSSSLQIQNVNRSIKRLEEKKEKLKKEAPKATTKTPSVKKPTGKIGEGTVLRRGLSKADTQKTVKKFDSVMRNAKGGKTGFGRKLLGKIKFSGSGKRTAMRGKIR